MPKVKLIKTDLIIFSYQSHGFEWNDYKIKIKQALPSLFVSNKLKFNFLIDV